MLTVMGKDSPSLRLYDIRHAVIGQLLLLLYETCCHWSVAVVIIRDMLSLVSCCCYYMRPAVIGQLLLLLCFDMLSLVSCCYLYETRCHWSVAVVII